MQEYFRRVLVGADGTKQSQFAIQAAVAIAKKFGSEFHCVGVMRPPSAETEAEGVGLEDLNQSHQSVRDQVNSCADQAREKGLTTTAQFLAGDPESAIEEYALKTCIDLIVVGHHHLNRLRRFLEGSTSDNLVEHASASVLVIRSPFEKG
jgi:nucleotide-binding universal stress UspA family protein